MRLRGKFSFFSVTADTFWPGGFFNRHILSASTFNMTCIPVTCGSHSFWGFFVSFIRDPHWIFQSILFFQTHRLLLSLLHCDLCEDFYSLRFYDFLNVWSSKGHVFIQVHLIIPPSSHFFLSLSFDVCPWFSSVIVFYLVRVLFSGCFLGYFKRSARKPSDVDVKAQYLQNIIETHDLQRFKVSCAYPKGSKGIMVSDIARQR